MPAKSRAQQRALYAKMGAAWVHAHHFDVVAGQSTKPPPKKKKRKK